MKLFTQIEEGRHKQIKFNELTKLYMLTIMIPYQMWKEYDVYHDFFDMSDEDKKQYEYLNTKLIDCYDNNKRVTFKEVNFYFSQINKLADYMLKQDIGKQEKKVWEKIKENVNPEKYHED